jgi:DNA-directed RNA polymerase specialized sigma24 family protein
MGWLGQSRETLSSEQAKDKVFACWNHLDALSRKRFPSNENLAHEALLHCLNELESEQWKRVQSWQGQGDFLPYLLTIASRLLTDFKREKFGHIRMPGWIAEKPDPLWQSAYRLLMVEKHSRQEVIDMLHTIGPSRDVWFIEEVVHTVLAKCKSQPRSQESNVPIENCEQQASFRSEPEAELRIKDDELLQALVECLHANNDPSLDPRVAEIRARLSPHICLSDEDRLMLRMRFLDGVNLKTIVQMLGIQGDPYKRLNKLIRQLRTACEKAGLLDF